MGNRCLAGAKERLVRESLLKLFQNKKLAGGGYLR